MNFIKKIFLKQDFLSLAGNLSYAAFGFISFLILTRTFEQEIFGEWVLFVTASNFIDMFRFGITRTAVVRFLSGAEENEKNALIGANTLISIIFTAIVAIPILLTNFIFPDFVEHSNFKLFFIWYPLFSVSNLFFNNALTVLQAKMKFGGILFLRTFNIILFVLFLTANILYLNLSVSEVALYFILINAVTSAYSFIRKWDGTTLIFSTKKEVVNKILNFGKFTTGTLIGSNLLKSADTFIIGLSPIIGTTGVALYSIPLKLTEVMEIPLRSFSATAFPKMSKASIEKNLEKVKEIFYTYSGALTILFIPFAIFNFIFAEFFVTILGGPEYVETANIYRVFCLYGLILPLDRFTGVGLDAINKPKENFYKVVFMVLANIIGDLIAVFVFKDIFSVALITIIMTVVGIFVGYYFFNKEIDIKFIKIFTYGKDFLLKFKNKI